MFLFDLVLIQVHGQILVDSFNWMFFARVNSDKVFLAAYKNDNKTDRKTGQRELKHAVVHHVEKNEYTMEYVQKRMAN